MKRRTWQCPHCDAEWMFIEQLEGLFYCFRCWRTWLPWQEATTSQPVCPGEVVE